MEQASPGPHVWQWRGIFLAGNMQRESQKGRLCRDTLKSMVKTTLGLASGALQGCSYNTATAKLGQGVGCGFEVGW